MSENTIFHLAGNANEADFVGALQRFSNNRFLRAGAVHGMSGMAAISASTYKVDATSLVFLFQNILQFFHSLGFALYTG